VKPFKKEGVWSEIWEYLNARNKLLDEIEKTLRQEDEYDVMFF